MTAARRPRKTLGKGIVSLCFAALFGAAALAGPAARVVSDWHTGLAIYGYDPVTYFTDAKPGIGRDTIEFRTGNAIWRFRNESNRAAFAADPEVYTPRFGGYDPLGVARGVGTPGHPEIWVRRDDRIYLFAKPESRMAFMAGAQEIVAAADAKWPEVQKTISP
jgi:hypothetical protein